MAKDLLSILREVRGSQAPEEPISDGIYWDIAIKLYNGNPGMYGDIIFMYNSLKDLNAVGLRAVIDNIDKVTTVASSIDCIVNVCNDLGNINIVADKQIQTGNQLLGKSVIRGIQFMAQESAENEQILIPVGTHAFSVEGFTLKSGSVMTIEPGSIYKIL